MMELLVYNNSAYGSLERKLLAYYSIAKVAFKGEIYVEKYSHIVRL